MNEDDVLEGLVETLRSSSAGLSASELARRLRRPRRDINAILYARSGEIFRRSPDERPKWTLLSEGTRSPHRSDQVRLPTALAGPIHIDFQGGDWSVDIRAVAMSRNDPPIAVERIGPRQRLISVSTVYEATSGDQPTSGEISSTTIAMAAAALVWEIAVQMGVVKDDEFDWGNAVRDVMLSLAAHTYAGQEPLVP